MRGECKICRSLFKGAAAIIQNMVSTDEEVVYNDLALFFTAKLLYEAIDELEEFLSKQKD